MQSTALVRNYIPRSFNRIAIIGEAPGKDEEQEGRPFVGVSGRFLGGLCSSVGFAMSNCFLGNIAQVRPPDNKIEHFSWADEEIQYGLDVLRDEIHQLNPNVILLLGNTALKAAKDPSTSHPLKGGRFRYSVSDWRGSIFTCNEKLSPFYGRKCIPAYHPAACLRQYDWTPLLRFDLKRARDQSATSTWTPPQRKLTVDVNAAYIISRFEEIERNKTPIALDIEGGIGELKCCSFAVSPHDVFIVPFSGPNGNFFPTLEEETAVWKAMARVLANPTIPKILQNFLYDAFVFFYDHHLVIRGIADDTMLKHWEAYCELPKGLGFLCSIYTDEPFYKHERKGGGGFHEFWTYCCRDSGTTYEISNVLDTHLSEPGSKSHYRFNISMLYPLLYMQYRGIRYDTLKAKTRHDEVLSEAYHLNHALDVHADRVSHFSLSPQDALAKVVSIVAKKREAGSIHSPGDLYGKVLKPYTESVPFLVSVLTKWPNLTTSEKGEFNLTLDLGINTKSDGFKDYLYRELKLPVQYKINKEDKKVETTDYEALLSLVKVSDHPAARLGIDIASRRTRSQMLSVHADADGRIRCGYNTVGTETGRLTCYTSPTGSGFNLQTVPDDDRDLFLADEDYDFFQCDLAGADSWTVAAWMNFLGEPTMLEDLKAGLKPAKILALLRRHGAEINNLTRPELSYRCKEVGKHDWDYFASKQGTHGTCYLMGARTLAKRIFIGSEGKISLSEKEVSLLQNLFLLRYKVTKWHAFVQSQLNSRPVITSSCGQSRHFFGRRDEILSTALAHEPQLNTTYITNLATQKLWTDPENRRPDGSLIIEPLHSVHDALCGQWPKAVRDWARGKVRSYFDNTITIANQQIKIPFEGGFGQSWGETNQGVI